MIFHISYVTILKEPSCSLSFSPSKADADSYCLLLKQKHICILLKLHFSTLQLLRRRQWNLGKMQQLKRLTGPFFESTSIKSRSERSFLVKKQFNHHKRSLMPDLFLPEIGTWKHGPLTIVLSVGLPTVRSTGLRAKADISHLKFWVILETHWSLSANETKLKCEWWSPHNP